METEAYAIGDRVTVRATGAAGKIVKFVRGSQVGITFARVALDSDGRLVTHSLTGLVADRRNSDG